VSVLWRPHTSDGEILPSSVCVALVSLRGDWQQAEDIRAGCA